MSNLTLKLVDPDNRRLWIAEYEANHFRFLLSGGEVYDVLAIGDDSELRHQLVSLFGKDRHAIEGVATVNYGPTAGTFRFVAPGDRVFTKAPRDPDVVELR